MGLMEPTGKGLKLVKRSEVRRIIEENGESHSDEQFEITVENASGDTANVKSVDPGDDAKSVFVIEIKLRRKESPAFAETLALAVMRALNLPNPPSLSDLQKDFLDQLVDEREMTVRTANCLGSSGANIRYIGELVQRTEMDLLNLRGFGRRSLKEVKKILQTMDLSLGMAVGDWVPPNKRTKPDEA